MDVLSTIILLGILLLFLSIGVPIAFAMGFSGILGILIFVSPVQLNQVASIVFNQGTSGSLMVAPMFILMAEILIISGISKDLFESIFKWFGRIPGSLAVTSVVTSAAFSSVSGSSPATVATIGGISAPEMINRNYSRKLAAGAIVTGGTLGILIPPSMALIIYGITTETSIVKLFMAGIIPGILVTLLLSLSIVFYAFLNPEAAPYGKSFTWKERFGSLYRVLPVALLAFVILYSMYSGMATPTEAAGVGVVIAIIISIAMRRLNWQGLKQALVKSASTSCMLIFLILGGSIFSFIISYLGVTQDMLEVIVSLNLNKWVVLIIFMLILIVLGMFIDPLSLIVLTLPFMFPVVTNLGFDPIWFGIMVVITAEIGMITPPVGLNLFVLKSSVPQLHFENDIVKGALPFVLVLLVSLCLIAIFPQIVFVFN